MERAAEFRLLFAVLVSLALVSVPASGAETGKTSPGPSAHKMLSCGDCHYAGPRPADGGRIVPDICGRCHLDKHLASAARHSSPEGFRKAGSRWCVECHGSHEIGVVEKTGAEIVEKCRKCHGEVFAKYESSVHGAALLKENVKDAPVCTDCHHSHSKRTADAESGGESAGLLCAKCHMRAELMARHGLSAMARDTYFARFHGGDPRGTGITCADCHGAHDIMRESARNTEKMKARLADRCIRCHETRAEDIPASWLSHYLPMFSENPSVFVSSWISRGVLWLLTTGFVLQLFIHAWRFLVGR